MKDIPLRDRLIFPLDVPTWDEAKALVHELGDAVTFYKIGLELFVAGGESYTQMARWLRDEGKQVMADIKFFDVPRTVGATVRGMRDSGATFVTVHGSDGILEAAVRQKGDLRILAVTVLTSLTEQDQQDLGFRVPIEELVLSRARRALAIGCDGVISSGLEAPALREELGERFIIVVPGVRPGTNDELPELVVESDDQARTTRIREAFGKGADYIVVGRPIRNAANPREAAEKVQRVIERCFNQNAAL